MNFETKLWILRSLGKILVKLGLITRKQLFMREMDIRVHEASLKYEVIELGVEQSDSPRL